MALFIGAYSSHMCSKIFSWQHRPMCVWWCFGLLLVSTTNSTSFKVALTPHEFSALYNGCHRNTRRDLRRLRVCFRLAVEPRNDQETRGIVTLRLLFSSDWSFIAVTNRAIQAKLILFGKESAIESCVLGFVCKFIFLKKGLQFASVYSSTAQAKP